MAKQVLQREQVIAGSLDDVFSFFENPHNLKEITPPWLNFRVKSASEETVRRGTRISYAISWFGLPLRWESRISEYERNVLFADEMLMGPYKSWYHTHSFRDIAGRVLMTDRVEYEMPFGWLGWLAHAVLVRRQLEAIFAYRSREIGRILDPPTRS